MVHARKKTTGEHFAMKIQLKTALVSEHNGHLTNLHTEKTVFANCMHPFVVDMNYALQTNEHAVLVLSLVDGGDLNDLLWRAPGGKLLEYHARIYTAQIAMALSHLHEIGIIYRDLKPENVLISSTGNLKLTDMGLAAPIIIVDKESGSGTELTNSEVFEGGSLKGGKEKAWTGDDRMEMQNSIHLSSSKKAGNINLQNNRLLSKRNSIDENAEIDQGALKNLQGEGGHNSEEKEDDDSSGPDDDDEGNDADVDRDIRGEKRDSVSSLRKESVAKVTDTDLSNIASHARIEGEEPVDPTGNARKRSSMMVQTAKMSQNSAAKALKELARLSAGGVASPVKMASDDVVKNRIKRMSVVGTRGYMAPEIVEGKVFARKDRKGYDEVVDWFALGVTIFVMLTGIQPFNDEDPMYIDPETESQVGERSERALRKTSIRAKRAASETS